MTNHNFILYGHILSSSASATLQVWENHYAVCEQGRCAGIFSEIPPQYKNFPVINCENSLIMPGLVDLHLHAPQFSYRSLGMDLELLDWLETYTFPEESRYCDLSYAQQNYMLFVQSLIKSSTTRAVCFATAHTEATLLLMELLEQSGLKTLVGRVNMDRNCNNDALREPSASASLADTQDWLSRCATMKHCKPIITPRFTPSCSDALMQGLGQLATAHHLPIQSHLDENLSEIAWVKELCPEADSYADTYAQANLLGAQTIMAHCVEMTSDECDMLKKNGVYIAHCPQSNINLASGIAPIRQYLDQGQNIGLGSDIAGGAHLSIFRAMADAVQVSKLYWRLVNQNDAPLSTEEAFYLATRGGGSFFGKVGAFECGYEFDAIVLDDSVIFPQTQHRSPSERLARVMYLCEDRALQQKYVAGKRIF